MDCPSCGSAVPEGARFCPSCGWAVSTRVDERRVATVLFGDVVGFTSFAEGRDPESVKNLIAGCFQRLAADVLAFGGRVDKIVGDEIMALFGAPVAHEDDAERAVRAGLRMVETIRGYADETDADLRMRIGINTGVVLVGALRAGGEYTAMGDVVNTASRLQSQGQPGRVLVGQGTYEATREVIRYEPVGPLQARGRDEPVEAWAALEALAPPGSRPRRMRTPLVGRKAEVGMLWHAFGTAFEHRRPHLVLVVGEAGVGKTRLAEEATQVARTEQGAVLLDGRCLPYGEANAWWPVAEALRDAFGIEASDPAEAAVEKCRRGIAGLVGPAGEGVEAGRIADGVLYILGYEGPLHDLDPTRAREEAIRSLQLALQAYAERHPLIIQLSEIHWADDLVLEVVDRLLERARDLPAVVLATARPELYERWTPKPGRYNLVVLNLDPLDRQASLRLLEHLLGSNPSPELAEMVVERAGGNPLFLEELAGLLSDSPSAAPELPATLRGLVAARLDALSASERAALEDAAVLGRQGPIDLLAEMGKTSNGAGLTAALNELVDKDLLAVHDESYAFKSELVREVAYETITKGERARRHAALAESLEAYASRTGRENEFLERIAHHYGTAAELAEEVGTAAEVVPDIAQRALSWLLRAAERAEARETTGVAGPLYEQALRLTPAHDTALRRRLLLGRAVSRATARELDDARDDALQALEQAQADDDLQTQARALAVLGEIEQKEGRYEASEASLERAVELWERVGDDRGKADALRCWGMTMLHSGRPQEADGAISQALAIFRSLEDRRGEAWALQNLAWISFYSGDYDTAEHRLHEADRLFAEVGDFSGRGWAIGLLGYVHYFKGDLDSAGAIAERGVTSIRELGDPWAHGMMVNLLAVVRLWQGRATETLERGEEAVKVFERIGDAMGLVQSLLPLGWANLLRGNVDAAFRFAERGREVAEDVPDLRMTAWIASAQIASAAGDGRLAEEWIREATVSRAPALVQEGATIGLALLQQARTTEAIASLEEADAAAQSDGESAFTSCVMALAYAAAGRPDDATAAAERVVDLDGAGSGPPRKGLPSGGSYLDRIRALLALGFAAAKRREAEGCERAFADAVELADASDDLLHQALVRLARSYAIESLGSGDAPECRRDALARLERLGMEPGDWETVFRLATSSRTPAA